MPTFGSALWGGSGAAGAAPPSGIAIRPLLYLALRLAGVTKLPDGSYLIPSADQLSDAIALGNLMINQANIRPLMIFTETISTYVLGTSETYTLGPGGNLFDQNGSSIRPLRIDRARLILASGGTPVHLKVYRGTYEEFSDLAVQLIPGAIPQFIYCDQNFPTATIYLVPQDQGGDQLELYTPTRIQQVQTAADLVAFPEGYDDWYVQNLAVRLASAFHLEIADDVRKEASRTARAIQMENSKSPRLVSDTPGRAHTGGGTDFNYFDGSYDR